MAASGVLVNSYKDDDVMDDNDKKEMASLFLDVLKKAREGEGDERLPPVRAKDVQASDLLDVYKHVHRECPFQEGDLVEQDPTLGAYRYPGEGVIAIVTQIGRFTLKPQSAQGAYRREDIIILCLVDGKWIEFAVESWRFKKVELATETKH